MNSSQNITNTNSIQTNEEKSIGNSLDDFEILKVLGEGAFGCVFKAKSKKNKKIYALKRPILKNASEREKNRKEILLLKYLNHENICKCFSEFKTPDGNQYMVMEQYNNQDLNKFVESNIGMKRPIREEVLWNIFYQCIEALSYLHLQGIIHCDIKIGNIFMTEEGKIVLGDFGEAMVKDSNILNRIT